MVGAEVIPPHHTQYPMSVNIEWHWPLQKSGRGVSISVKNAKETDDLLELRNRKIGTLPPF